MSLWGSQVDQYQLLGELLTSVPKDQDYLTKWYVPNVHWLDFTV